MSYFYLLLLATQSFALNITLPESFGGKTEFSDKGWRMLIGQLSPEVKFGQPPKTQINIGVEPTCFDQFPMCSTSYFGKFLTLKKPYSAELWVKWHQDATPFACDSVGGCTITSARSVADLTAQSDNWRVTASLNANTGTHKDSPTLNGKSKAQLRIRYAKAPITPKTIASTRTLTSKCSRNHMCYIHTGTLMVNIRGKCDSKPLIVCDRYHFPCEEFNYPTTRVCSQWATFTQKYCRLGVTTPGKEQCSMNVAVTGDNSEPISFQVFEQKPMPGKKKLAKLDSSSAESPFGELSDGSSGAWMAWRYQGQ